MEADTESSSDSRGAKSVGFSDATIEQQETARGKPSYDLVDILPAHDGAHEQSSATSIVVAPGSFESIARPFWKQFVLHGEHGNGTYVAEKSKDVDVLGVDLGTRVPEGFKGLAEALLGKRLAHPVDIVEEMVDENAAVRASAEGAKQIRGGCCGTAVFRHDDIQVGGSLEGADGQIERRGFGRAAWKVVEDGADAHIHGSAVVEAGLWTVSAVGFELVNLVIVLILASTCKVLG